MRILLICFALVGSINANAFIARNCETKLTEFSQAFLMKNSVEMFNAKSEQLTIEFLSFKNTTPGSFDQEYEVVIDVTWPSETSNFPFGTVLTLTLYSPRICDRLELRGISGTGN